LIFGFYNIPLKQMDDSQQKSESLQNAKMYVAKNGRTKIFSIFKKPELETPQRKIGTFGSFKFRNYKLWFFGQATSLLGTWMQTSAQQYLIYELTGSSAFVGTVSFVSGIPSWIFMLFAGTVADRMSKRRLMIITQIGMMILAFILAALVFLGLITPTWILVLAFMLGLFNAFDAPARQAFVSELVDREHLSNAIAMNSLMFNLGTALGPAIGGFVYYLFRPGWCFTINGISFVAVIIALSMMVFPNEKLKLVKTDGSSFLQLKEGFKFVWQNRQVRYLIFMLAVTTLCSSAVVTLFPAWSKTYLGGDERLFGFMMSARGLGAIFSAFLIASLGNTKFKNKLLHANYFVFPLIIVGFSFIRSQILSLLVLFFFGFSLILLFNLTNSLVQESTPNHLRGRIMGIYSFTFFGLMPIGSLWIGWVARFTSEQISMLIAAGMAFVVALVMSIFAPKFREI
jgi:MFS family permease